MATINIKNIDIETSRIVLLRDDQDRARQVIHRSNHGHPYKFPSLKCGRIMHLDHGYERDRAIIHEFDPAVIYFREQPFTILYDDESGGGRRIYPDFAVYGHDGRVVIEEVKPAKIAEEEEVKNRFNLERMILEHHGYHFQVVTEAEIQGPQLQNSLKLRSYRRIIVNHQLKDKVQKCLRGSGASARELLALIPELTSEQLLALLAQGYITTEMSIPISIDSHYKVVEWQSSLALEKIMALNRRCK